MKTCFALSLFLLCTLASSCRMREAALATDAAARAGGKCTYRIVSKSGTGLHIVDSCNGEVKQVPLPGELARVVANPAAPYALVLWYKPLEDEFRENGSVNVDGKEIDCSKVAQYGLWWSMLDLVTGHLNDTDEVGDSFRPNDWHCIEPKPDVARFRDLWSPKGRALVLESGGITVLCPGPKASKACEAYLKPPTVAELLEERDGKPVDPKKRRELPEYDKEMFLQFEGWLSETTFAYTARCCDAADLFTYDPFTQKKRYWGVCDTAGGNKLDACVAKKKAMIRAGR